MRAKFVSIGVEYDLNIQTMWKVEQMGYLFRSIQRLARRYPREAINLAKMGAYIAEILDNDVDLRNEELKAFYGAIEGQKQ